MIILGIDPGTANTAVVIWCEERGLLGTAMIKTKPVQDENEFETLINRGREVREKLLHLLRSLPDMAISIDCAAIEAYRDYGGGHKREVKKRFYTPNTMAYIAQALEIMGVPIIWQDPAKVLPYRRVFASEIQQYKALSNQHLRDAATHAIYFYHLRNRIKL